MRDNASYNEDGENYRDASRENVAQVAKTANEYREEIAELRNVLAHVQGSDVALMELLAASRARVAELTAALLPFVDWGEYFLWPECPDKHVVAANDDAPLFASDIRRAARLLSPQAKDAPGAETTGARDG